MSEEGKMNWTVDQTKTQETDLRIIQGHYPYCVKTDLGEHVALVKSQKKARTGFAKASEVNDRDEAWNTFFDLARKAMRKAKPL